METLQGIETARAFRHYLDKPVPAEVMATILNAGRITGSAKNRQPWQFVVLRDREHMQRVSTTGNAAGPIARSAFSVAIIIEDGGYPLDPVDAGRALQSMILAAHSLGLAHCPITLHNAEAAREVLRIPQGRRLAVAVAFGYPDRSKAEAEKEFRQQMLAQLGRRALAEVATENTCDGPPLNL